MSAATIDRLLAAVKVQLGSRGRCGTRPGTLLRSQIPVRTEHWDVEQPGYIEADTVAHCGESMSGDFVWSLTMTDVQTQWTETRALWNRGQHAVRERVAEVEQALPFTILGFDSDNGGEVLNWHLVDCFAAGELELQRLEALRAQLNPFALKRAIERKLRKVLRPTSGHRMRSAA